MKLTCFNCGEMVGQVFSRVVRPQFWPETFMIDEVQPPVCPRCLSSFVDIEEDAIEEASDMRAEEAVDEAISRRHEGRWSAPAKRRWGLS